MENVMAKTPKKLLDAIMLKQLQDCRLIVEQKGNVNVYFLTASMQRFMLVSLCGFILAFVLLCAYTFQLGYNNHQLANTAPEIDAGQPAVRTSPADGQAMLASADAPMAILMAIQEDVPAETDNRLMIFETNISIALR